MFHVGSFFVIKFTISLMGAMSHDPVAKRGTGSVKQGAATERKIAFSAN
jgi:hypothetical protein